MGLLNFYENWRKASDYERLKKENEWLVSNSKLVYDEKKRYKEKYNGVMNEVSSLQKFITNGTSFECNYLDFVVEYMKKTDKHILSLKSQLQNRDPNTGRYIHKKVGKSYQVKKSTTL